MKKWWLILGGILMVLPAFTIRKQLLQYLRGIGLSRFLHKLLLGKQGTAFANLWGCK